MRARENQVSWPTLVPYAPAVLTTDRLGSLSESRLQDGLDRFGLGRLLHAEAATTGNFGQNAFLDTDRGRYVLRGNPLFPGQFAKESFFADLFHDHCSVPAPWPYHYEPSTELFGWPYVIMGRLEGRQVADQDIYASLTPLERGELAQALGTTATMISSVPGELTGHWDAESGTIVPLEAGWGDWVRSTVLEILDRANAVTADDRRLGGRPARRCRRSAGHAFRAGAAARRLQPAERDRRSDRRPLDHHRGLRPRQRPLRTSGRGPDPSVRLLS